MNDPHHRHRIAAVGPCIIEQCACGTLHVEIGVVTLRLHPSTAQALDAALTKALVLTRAPALVELLPAARD
jgi:hypothetical protein